MGNGLLIPAGRITAETLELAKNAFADPANRVNAGPGLQKAGINIAENLVGINLEAPSKKLFPVYSPLRNRIPRIASAVGASAVQWKSIDAINSAKLRASVPENTRNSFNTTATTPETAGFTTFGHDDYVGFEALSRSKGFEDVRATAALNLLYSVMISEESLILGGNITDLGLVTGGATGTGTSGGALAAGTYIVVISALTLYGNFLGAKKPGSDAAEADGENIGAAIAGQVVDGTGSDDTVTVTWDALKGAVAYNVFMDDGAAGAQKYVTTVFTNAVTITALGTGVAPNTTDLTGNANDFDGIIKLVSTKATGTLFKSLDDAALTADGAGGITEFDDMMKEMWDTYRLGPTSILVNSQQAKDITAKIGGSSNLAYRIHLEDGQRNVVGGIYVSSYLNKFASSFAEGFPNDVPIKVHPDLPAGTIIFLVEALPYPTNQIPNVWEIETLQEYTQYEWALTSRRYEFGIYGQEVLKDYFAKANGMLVCVKAG